MKKAVAIDLDGTLLRTNTFRDYLLYCGKAALHDKKLCIDIKILWWVMLRKLRIVSHSAMKKALLDTTANFILQNGRINTFVIQEMTYLNANVMELAETYRKNGAMLILCTAAPELYAKPISDRLGMDCCCATPLPANAKDETIDVAKNKVKSETKEGAKDEVKDEAKDEAKGNWQECSGNKKLEALINLLEVNEAEIEAVITDHKDDLPLLRYNSKGRNHIVAPSDRFLKILNSEFSFTWETL